jgi:omega-6 fatty acid desaturase (delta-12 desaturase)
MTVEATPAHSRNDIAAWKAVLARFQRPNTWRALWQVLNTVVVYLALWWGLYLSLRVSWWLTLPLAMFAGLMLVRVFIIFHDCGHGSFFRSRWANDALGIFTGLLTFTPYYYWRGEHAIHHGSTGDLGRRGIGDIWTMTVQEYLEAGRWKRFAYRLSRNPVVLFAVAPLVVFLYVQRWPRKGAHRRERLSVWATNAALLVLAAGMCLWFGVVPYLVIQLIVLLVGGSAGVYLFYLQHQFEDVYWERGRDWDYVAAALQGSSFFKLPKVLQWFSGNIGFHHVHHLSTRIPNYNLQRCHESDPRLLAVRPMTLLGSLKTLGLRLWDESAKKLVTFRQMRRARRQQEAAGRPGAGETTSGRDDSRRG